MNHFKKNMSSLWIWWKHNIATGQLNKVSGANNSWQEHAAANQVNCQLVSHMIEYKEESKSFSVHQSAETSIYNMINVPHCEYLVIYRRWSHQMIQRIWRNLFGRLWSSDSIKIRAWAQEHIQKSPSYYIHIPLQTYDLFVYVWFQIFKTSQNTSKESSLVSVCFQRNCFRFTNDHQEIIISQILFSKWAKNCSNAWQTKVTAIISAMGWTYIRKKPYHCIVYYYLCLLLKHENFTTFGL